MKRLSNWIAGILTGLIAYRLWKRHSTSAEATAPAATPEPEPDAAAESDDRAEELRAKLAEARATEEPPPAVPAEEQEESIEERRRRVHEEGRAAIDRMHDH